MKTLNSASPALSDNDQVFVLNSQNLRVGDIILSTTKSIVSLGIRTVTRSEISHAALHVGDGFIIEAVPGGVRRIHSRASSYLDKSQIKVLRPQGLEQEQLAFAAKTARQLISRPYSVTGAIGSVLPLIRHRSDPGRFCSQIVAEAFASAKANLFANKSDKTPQSVTPENIRSCNFLKDVTDDNCIRTVRRGSLNHAMSEIQPVQTLSRIPSPQGTKTITAEEFEHELLVAGSATMSGFDIFEEPYHLVDILRQLEVAHSEDRRAAEALNETMEKIVRCRTVDSKLVEPKLTVPGLIEEAADDCAQRFFNEGTHPDDAKELTLLLKDLDAGRNADLREWDINRQKMSDLAKETNYSSIIQLHFWMLGDLGRTQNTYRWLPTEFSD